MARPIVSVILSGKNEASFLEPCFAAIAAQKCKFPFEVHFVDNGSSDGTYAKARKLCSLSQATKASTGKSKLYSSLKSKSEFNSNRNKIGLSSKNPFFVWKEKKPGHPAAFNFGAKKARGKVLVFSHLDCLPEKNWLQEIAGPLLEPITYPLAAIGGATQSEFRQSGRPNLFESYADSLYQFWEKDRTSATPAFLPWSPASNFAIKRDIFVGIGGFDANWKLAAFDVDLCWRLVLCGFQIGHAPNAIIHRRRKATLRSLLRQMEHHAFYQHSLVHTYERELNLSKISVRKRRIVDKSKRLLSSIRDPRELARVKMRAVDMLVLLSASKGALEATVNPVKPNPLFSATRRGEAPVNLLRTLPRGYSYLHNEGWVYWKSPSDVNQPGSLMLFQPKKRKRIHLSEMEWKIWEVKSERGQSEDAAAALGESESNEDILHTIDEITLRLHTRHLLPMHQA